MTNPRVSLLSASLSPRGGGVSAAVYATGQALAQTGLTVNMLGMQDDLFDPSALPSDLVDVQTSPSLTTIGMQVAPRLFQTLAEAKPDIVHLHGLWLYPSFVAGRYARKRDVPLIISPHGMLDPWALRNSAWKKKLALRLFERKNLETTAFIHVLNKQEHEAVRACGLKNPIATIPNGVDLPDLGKAVKRPDWMASLDKRVLLFLGRIHPKKGVSELIRGWARAIEASPHLSRKWVLAIVGWDDGGHLPALRSLTASLGAEQTVLFPGAVYGQEKESTLAHSSAFILPSYSEGLPMAVLEAWSWGCPVFMSDQCNLPEGFEMTAACRVSPDPDQIAGVLATSLDEDALALLGKSGRRLVETSFTWPRVARDLRECYRWAVKKGETPNCLSFSKPNWPPPFGNKSLIR